MMPVRNEAWILERSLKSLSLFSDIILVLYQPSTDGTLEILNRFAPKVVIIDNNEPGFCTRFRWRLLEAARQYEGTNVLISTDADEILSSNILDPGMLDRISSLPPGASMRLELVNLWRSAGMWRNDESIWSGRWMEIGFRDDRVMQFRPFTQILGHNDRIPPSRECATFDSIKLLHFQFVNFDRMLSKQNRYRVMEAVELGSDRAEEINLRYCITRDERKVHVDAIDPAWTAGWTSNGIDLTSFEESDFYWYDVDVLRNFNDRGLKYFAPIDIWDTDWEAKRRLAAEKGVDGIPSFSITDPRSAEERLYHFYLHQFYGTPPWRDPKEIYRLSRSLLRAGARAVGLRRHHLERIGVLRRQKSESSAR